MCQRRIIKKLRKHCNSICRGNKSLLNCPKEHEMQKTEPYCNDQKDIPHCDESLEKAGTAVITSVQLM